MLLYSASGSRPRPGTPPAPLPKTAGFLDAMEDPAELPSWLSTEDLDFFSAEFERTGFTGGLNWYRCLDRTWELMAPHHGQKIAIPASFIVGDRDGVYAMNPAGYDHLEQNVPLLKKKSLIPGVGHWTQQEAPEAVNKEMLDFLRSLN